MSYRIQIELDESDDLKEKVLLHRKFIDHFRRRKLDADARGRTNWTMTYASERGRFTIIWTRDPHGRIGKNLIFKHERLIGYVVIKFSKADIDEGGAHLVTGDWQAIEDRILESERAV